MERTGIEWNNTKYQKDSIYFLVDVFLGVRLIVWSDMLLAVQVELFLTNNHSYRWLL